MIKKDYEDPNIKWQLGLMEHALEGLNQELAKEYMCPYYIREKLNILLRNINSLERSQELKKESVESQLPSFLNPLLYTILIILQKELRR